MTTFKMLVDDFNAEQSHQLKTTFVSANKRVFIFKGATVTVSADTNEVLAVQIVDPVVFDMAVAIRRMAFDMGYVIHKGERHEVVIVQEPRSLFQRFISCIS